MGSFGSRAAIALCLSLAAVFLMGPSGRPAYGADAYPSRPITLIVSLVPGGLADLGARCLAEAMEKELKQPVVVVNRPGGAMTVGGYATASAKPDGYTFGYLLNPTAVPEAYTYFQAAPYTSADLKPVCKVQSFFIGIMVKGDAPWSSMKELIDYARKNPGMKFGHNGKSTLQYVAMTSIAKAEKISLVGVPYDGDASQIPAVLGGHIPVGTFAYSVGKQLIDAKKIKVLALSAERKVPMAPGVPVLGEMGYKLPYYSSFFALFAPKKTPDEIVRKISATVRKIVDDKDFQNKNKALGIAVTYEDTAAFEKYLGRFKTNMQAFFKEEGLTK